MPGQGGASTPTRMQSTSISRRRRERQRNAYKLNCQGRPRRRFLVNHRLRRRRAIFQKKSINAYSPEQPHGGERRRRLGRHSVRRLRRRDAELSADHSWLELHGSALSTAERNSRWQLEVSGGPAGKVTPPISHKKIEHENHTQTNRAGPRAGGTRGADVFGAVHTYATFAKIAGATVPETAPLTEWTRPIFC